MDKIFAPEVVALLENIPQWVPVVGIIVGGAIALSGAANFIIKDPLPKLATGTLMVFACSAWVVFGY